MAFELKLYLLELVNEKYYVGQAANPEFRFSEHVNGKGAKWTRLHKPLRIRKVQVLSVDSARETMLYENWMTLQAMERFGWQNVRGGDFLEVEANRLQDRIKHIYDFSENKIRYYVRGNRYLFGSTEDWLVFVLKLENGRFYIGCSKDLGKSLGKHFNGTSIAWTRDNPVISVLEIITIGYDTTNLTEFKQNLLADYISRYGWDNVLGPNRPKKG